MLLADLADGFAFPFGDGVRGRFAVCCLFADEGVDPGGDEVGAADEAGVFSDAVEDLKLLDGYFDAGI